MSYLVSKRSWIKKITVSLTIALVLNPFAAVLGLNNKMVNAAEGTYNNGDDFEQVDASSLIPRNPSYTSESIDDDIAQTDIMEPLSVTDNVYGYFNLTNQVVISKIFGGGSQNLDALYQYDFIELYNPTDAPVDVTNWSVQYAVSSAKSDASSWQVTPLTGTIPARGHYLIQESGKADLTGKVLPTPDAIGTIDMDNKDGKVALVSDSTGLTVLNPATQGVSSFIDFVGYGAAKSYYGSGAAPANSAQKGIVRYALDLLDPSLVTKTSAMTGNVGELYGNSWNSHNNTEDFEQAGSSSLIVPRNSSYLTPMSVSVDKSIRVQMDSLNTISASNNHFAVVLATGKVKDGSLSTDDYVVTGLPSGIHVIGALGNVVNNTITFTLGGTATVDVKSDVSLSVMIKKSANTLSSYDDSGTVSGITLYSSTPKVKGEVISNTLSMTEPTKVTGSLSIHLTTGTVKNGILLDTDYTMTGLPSGLSIQATGDTVTNTVTFTISGTTLTL